jgi:hypothetical protein
MNRGNGFSPVKQAVNEFAETTEPLLPSLSDADAPPEWWPGTVEEWRQAVNAAFPAMRARAILGFLERLRQQAHAAAAESRGLEAATADATPVLVTEARRLYAALQQDPLAMQRYDAEPGRKHGLAELAAGGTLGPSTRPLALCRAAAEALGELTTLAPAVPAAPVGTALTRDGLAKEAKVLRRDMRAADYKELAVQFGSNVSAVRRDLLDVEHGREDGPILAAARLVHLGKLVLEMRAVPAAAKR